MTIELQAGRALFVLLPPEPPRRLNCHAVNAMSVTSSLSAGLHSTVVSPLTQVLLDLELPVIDQPGPGDAALVALNAGERASLLHALPAVKLVSAELLEPMWLHRAKVCPDPSGVTSSAKFLEVQVVDALTREPLSGVDVMVLTDREARTGASAMTDRRGMALLHLTFPRSAIRSIEAYPRIGHWPSWDPVRSSDGGRCLIACMPVDPAAADVRRHFDLEGGDEDGRGVRVAVIDTGCDCHADLCIAEDSRNLVKGEAAMDIADALGHGTHVAGVIAGRGARGRGMRGVAPAADLVVYRVFGRGEVTSLSFDIAKGIRQAVADGCDLVNLSLGGAVDVPDIHREIERARDQGVICLAAAGNDYRQPVCYPARYAATIAVSAFGRQGTWPEGAAQALEDSVPRGHDEKDFIAAFSNVGREVQLTAPGLGVVSTSPGGYAVMDGTSMACPMATGAMARLLSRRPEILSMDRTRDRADVIARLALSAKAMGFGITYEGAGCLK